MLVEIIVKAIILSKNDLLQIEMYCILSIFCPLFMRYSESFELFDFIIWGTVADLHGTEST